MGEIIAFPLAPRRLRLPPGSAVPTEVSVQTIEDDGGCWGIFISFAGSAEETCVGTRFKLDDALAAADQLSTDLGIAAGDDGWGGAA